ncbi:MAG TPA: DNA helicase [Mesorhizobium sp.]|jgi:replicative DNA helicase|uniref:DNA helicase n=1 Tax=Mesorhizobium sp. TaxID=1871066 RepID=UPI002DDCDA3C|nr:DNA helicase [Mesorhizobium sp.]HEV2504201.1 DNA helicase [Mesorhizobium sp.]
MKLSVPAYQLKRQAKRLSREENIPLHAALDRTAAKEGFVSWSLLASRRQEVPAAARLLASLQPGDLLLVGARPRQGKTLFSLELAIEAMKIGRRSAFFSLEYTQKDIVRRFHALGIEPAQFDSRFEFDGSDAIDAGYMITALEAAPTGTLVVVDYLQLLDQKRQSPALADQIRELRSFARDKGLIFVFISQIDRSYDPANKPFPNLGDVRLPNPLDLSLFDRACFLNDGDVQFTA